MLADGMTKPLKSIKRAEFVKTLGLKRKEEVRAERINPKNWTDT